MIMWKELHNRKKGALQNCAMRRGIRHSKRTTRSELVQLLEFYDCATRIQEELRRWYVRRHPCVNTDDPILLEPLHANVRRLFVFRTSGGQRVAYNACTLAESVRQLGSNFKDPWTREPFTDTDFRRLERLSGEVGLLEASQRATGDEGEEEDETDGVVRLQETIEAVLDDMLAVVSHLNAHQGLPPSRTSCETFAEYLICHLTPVINVLCDCLMAASAPAYANFARRMSEWVTQQPDVEGLPRKDQELLSIVMECLFTART
jgi:hypothetical protein